MSVEIAAPTAEPAADTRPLREYHLIVPVIANRYPSVLAHSFEEAVRAYVAGLAAHDECSNSTPELDALLDAMDESGVEVLDDGDRQYEAADATRPAQIESIDEVADDDEPEEDGASLSMLGMAGVEPPYTGPVGD